MTGTVNVVLHVNIVDKFEHSVAIVINTYSKYNTSFVHI